MVTYLCIIENDYLKAIASVVLPAQILDYFIVVGVEQTKTEIHISLDECNNKELSDDIHFELLLSGKTPKSINTLPEVPKNRISGFIF